MIRNPVRFSRAARQVGRALLVAGIAGMLVPGPARAQQGSWLMRYLSGYDFLPNPPIRQDTTRFLVQGWFPFSCVVVSNARVIDAGHVELTIAPGPGCSASSPTAWSQLFPLGVLAAGNHSLEIALTVNRPDSGQVVERGSFEFGVVDTTVVPPPPPPPNPPPGFMPNVLQYFISPAQPNPNQATSVDLLGWFPYDCGEIANAAVVDTSDLALTLRPGPACSDTARMWRQHFDLGRLPAGHHPMTVHLTLEAPGVPDSLETGVIPILVYEDSGPPPSDPPGDSLRTVLSKTRPNPFATQTQFGVSLTDPVAGDVAIFDIAGRRIVTLFHGVLPRGTSQFGWDGRRADGRPAPGGIYFYRLATPSRVFARRVVLLGTP